MLNKSRSTSQGSLGVKSLTNRSLPAATTKKEPAKAKLSESGNPLAQPARKPRQPLGKGELRGGSRPLVRENNRGPSKAQRDHYRTLCAHPLPQLPASVLNPRPSANPLATLDMLLCDPAGDVHAAAQREAEQAGVVVFSSLPKMANMAVAQATQPKNADEELTPEETKAFADLKEAATQSAERIVRAAEVSGAQQMAQLAKDYVGPAGLAFAAQLATIREDLASVNDELVNGGHTQTKDAAKKRIAEGQKEGKSVEGLQQSEATKRQWRQALKLAKVPGQWRSDKDLGYKRANALHYLATQCIKHGANGPSVVDAMAATSAFDAMDQAARPDDCVALEFAQALLSDDLWEGLSKISVALHRQGRLDGSPGTREEEAIKKHWSAGLKLNSTQAEALIFIARALKIDPGTIKTIDDIAFQLRQTVDLHLAAKIARKLLIMFPGDFGATLRAAGQMSDVKNRLGVPPGAPSAAPVVADPLGLLDAQAHEKVGWDVTDDLARIEALHFVLSTLGADDLGDLDLDPGTKKDKIGLIQQRLKIARERIPEELAEKLADTDDADLSEGDRKLKAVLGFAKNLSSCEPNLFDYRLLGVAKDLWEGDDGLQLPPAQDPDLPAERAKQRWHAQLGYLSPQEGRARQEKIIEEGQYARQALDFVATTLGVKIAPDPQASKLDNVMKVRADLKARLDDWGPDVGRDEADSVTEQMRLSVVQHLYSLLADKLVQGLVPIVYPIVRDQLPLKVRVKDTKDAKQFDSVKPPSDATLSKRTTLVRQLPTSKLPRMADLQPQPQAGPIVPPVTNIAALDLSAPAVVHADRADALDGPRRHHPPG